jgi:ribosome biogenesis protein Nip4
MMTLAAYTTFTEQFVTPVPDELFADIVVQGKRVFHDPQHNKQWCDEHNITPHSVGIFLGETKHDFVPTPYCLDRISHHTEAEAVIDAKGAWLFLCGRDLFGKAIKSGDQIAGTPVFVYDEQHNLLGYGVWTAALNKNKPAILHKSDRGVYLRRR